MKKVLILSSSPRKNGNSDLLCKEFLNGATESGHLVDYVRLNDLNIGYCQGCYACTNLGRCYQNDDMIELSKKAVEADVIVFATPVYFYSMSAQLKTFIDRLVPDYLKIKADIYIIVTAWDSEEQNLLSTVEAIRGATRDCFENCVERGVIVAGGVDAKGDVLKTEHMRIAKEMGKNC